MSHQKASQIQPQNPDPYYSIGVIYVLMKNKDEALAQANVLSELDSEQHQELMNFIAKLDERSEQSVSPELAAIDLQSQSFEEQIKSTNKSPSGNTLLSGWDDPIIQEGRRIRDLYEELLENSPYDSKVRESMARHFDRMGTLFAEAVQPKESKRVGLHRGYLSQEADTCFERSFQLYGNPTVAYKLGILYENGRMYATALYWFEEAEKIAKQKGIVEMQSLISQRKLSLQSEGKTKDRAVWNDSNSFPDHYSRGLKLGFEPASAFATKSSAESEQKIPAVETPQSEASTKSGCGGTAALFALAVFTIVSLLKNWL